jgi:hypothetical protein
VEAGRPGINNAEAGRPGINNADAGHPGINNVDAFGCLLNGELFQEEEYEC